MTKQYTVTVNGTAYEVTVESVSGGRMASAPCRPHRFRPRGPRCRSRRRSRSCRGSRCPQGRSRRFRLR